MNQHFALTVIADDRPGIVEKVAEVVSNNDGNWLESAMSRLGGKFVGILLVRLPGGREADLKQALDKLANQGIRVSVEAADKAHSDIGVLATLTVLGNDRKGIVREISTMLASKGVNVEALKTSIENAPMSGELLFRTEATVELPQGLNRDDLVTLLEQLSDDLVVEFASDQ
jgi:glycine cleavage system regulatory protein